LVNHVEQRTQIPLSAGTVVAGKYRVERTLAEGGMGVVVVAKHIHLQQSVALKFLRGDVGTEWDALARFRGEAKAVAQLRSEHVAHVLDAGVTDDGVPYMVMEYLEGRSLGRKLQIQGAFEIASAVEYVIQACEGLAEAHARGIVHRDIKPYNLFLVEHSPGWGCVKIIDFGISKFAFSDSPNVVTGVIIGSPCYMSPEQLRSTATVDHRSDIWSLGATLYELLAGKAAFDASQTLPELVTAILEKSAPELRTLRPEVPEELAAVVARCLSKDRDARFQNAGEVATALLPFAPGRARVPAERAVSMKPSSTYDSRPAAPDPPSRSDSHSDPRPASPERGPGRSLAPISSDESRIGAEARALAETALVRRGGDPETGAEMLARKAPKWLGAATLGVAAALLFVAILVAAADNGSKAKAPAWSTAQSVTAPVLTRPETAPPAVTLAPVDPKPPALAGLLVRAFPTSARITIDGVAASGNPVHTSFPRDVDAHHRVMASASGYESKTQDVLLVDDVVLDISLSRRGTQLSSANASPASPSPRAPAPRQAASRPSIAAGGPMPIAQPPASASLGEVDPSGGRSPLHPIETKDPYGAP
jgi:eukaryotic-like serine/threonine-protein kinase